MTAATAPRDPRHPSRLGSTWVGVAAPAGLLAALGLAAWLRADVLESGGDPILVGVSFGVLLLVLARIATPGRCGVIARSGRAGVATAVGLGLVCGGLLVAIAATAPAGGLRLEPGRAGALLPWSLVTLLAATAEESLLRGALFDTVEAAVGVPAALAVTSLAFALMHVPSYGWGVVPLDAAVGLALGGLRLAAGGWLAPAVTHGVADLATWWL
ncbi:MAG TPA: CPBP family intramembrane glutamic endopeptidase [Candidatus Limnocylindrales bacterium]